MQRPVAEVDAALQRKGMAPDENHHHMYRMHVDGVTTLVTRISHSATVITDGLAKLMANQCALQLREFWSLVDCSLTEEDWKVLVRQRCEGGRNPFMRG
jgi:hypothetical protein